MLTSLAFALGAFSTGSFPVLLLPFAGAIAVHDCASNIVGTLRDMEGDRAGGFSTLPVRHGAGPATAVAAGCYTCAIALAAAGLWLQHRSSVPYALVAVAAVMGARAFWLLVTGPRPIPAPLALRSHAVLVLERIVLAGALLAAGAGPAAGLLLAVPLTAVSYLAQARMRAGHELPPHEGTP